MTEDEFKNGSKKPCDRPRGEHGHFLPKNGGKHEMYIQLITSADDLYDKQFGWTNLEAFLLAVLCFAGGAFGMWLYVHEIVK